MIRAVRGTRDLLPPETETWNLVDATVRDIFRVYNFQEIRTPIFEPKLDKYFKDLVAPEVDSINREVDMMLLFSRSNKEMFKYLLIHFVQKYINPEHRGQRYRIIRSMQYGLGQNCIV